MIGIKKIRLNNVYNPLYKNLLKIKKLKKIVPIEDKSEGSVPNLYPKIE